jgi:hypothetical protein
LAETGFEHGGDTTQPQLSSKSRAYLWLFGACGRNVHGMNLKPVQSSSYRRVTFSKLPSLLLADDFENGEPESATTCHDWAVKQKLASSEMLLKTATMLVHYAPLVAVHIVRERGARGDQLVEVVLFGHGTKNSSSEDSLFSESTSFRAWLGDE